jgi:hypothetical protein
MLSTDRDALICDMAETYHVYDMRALPTKTVATLACGLREDSRIKLKMAGVDYYPSFVPLMRIHDMLIDIFYGSEIETFRFRDEVMPARPSFGFESSADLEAELARFNKD